MENGHKMHGKLVNRHTRDNHYCAVQTEGAKQRLVVEESLSSIASETVSVRVQFCLESQTDAFLKPNLPQPLPILTSEQSEQSAAEDRSGVQ
jgi:hypothetical protein